MRSRILLLLVFLLALLAVGSATSLLFVHKVERDYLDDLEHSLTVAAQTLALHPPDAAALQAMQAQTGDRIRIFAADGTLVADSLQPPLPGDGDSLRARPEVQAAFGGRYGAFTRFADDTRASMALYVAVPCLQNGHVTGVVYVSHSTDDIMLKLERVRQPIRLAAVSVGVLVGLLGVTLALNVKATLDRVRATSFRMVAGHLDARMAVQGQDELAEIAEHFNRLAASLQDKIKDLEDERDKTRRFVQDITHELKTPLTGLSGSVQALETGAQDSPEQRTRFIANIASDCERLCRLVASLLEIQQLEHGSLRPVRFDVVSLAERVAAHYEATAAVRRISFQVHGENVQVVADPDKMERVLENLVENAVRHSPDDGVVVLEASQDGTSVRIQISDNGPGVAAEERPRLFERFYRGRSGAPGSAGLGLAIARDIVLRHGGDIGIDSPPGQGARFYVTLPE